MLLQTWDFYGVVKLNAGGVICYLTKTILLVSTKSPAFIL